MCKHSCHPPYIFCQVSVKRNMTFTVPKIVFFSVFYQEKWEIFRITQGRSHFIINRILCQQCVNINCKQPFSPLHSDEYPPNFLYLSFQQSNGWFSPDESDNQSLPKCQFDQEISLVPHKFLV